jgi:hypothetical protein
MNCGASMYHYSTVSMLEMIGDVPYPPLSVRLSSLSGEANEQPGGTSCCDVVRVAGSTVSLTFSYPATDQQSRTSLFEAESRGWGARVPKMPQSRWAYGLKSQDGVSSRLVSS